MLRPVWLGLLLAAAPFVAANGHAETITLKDEAGAPVEIDTAALEGCKIAFDSAGTPFEICRMRKVELTPPSSTRSRPGHGAEAAAQESAVVYVKAIE